MEVCQGPGPIIEEVGDEEETPDLSSPTEEAAYTTQEPLQIMTGPTSRSPDIDPVSVNSLYSVYIFNITPYIQINYKSMSIESFPVLVMPWPNRWPIGQAPRINTTFCSRRKETVQKLIKWIEKVMTDNEVHTVLSYFTRLYLSM